MSPHQRVRAVEEKSQNESQSFRFSRYSFHAEDEIPACHAK